MTHRLSHPMIEHHLTLGELKNLLAPLPAEAILYADSDDYSPRLEDYMVIYGLLNFCGNYRNDFDFKQETVGSFRAFLDTVEARDDSFVSLLTRTNYAMNGVRMNGDGSFTLTSAPVQL